MIALLTAGCRFAPQEEGGPSQMVYTPDGLRDKRALTRMPVAPQAFEEAAKSAWEKKIAGAVTYLIVRDAVFERSIAAWDKMVALFAQADADGVQPSIPAIGEEVAMQVAYLRRVNEKRLRDVEFANKPCLKIGTEKTSTHDIPGAGGVALPGKREVTTGSGKLWSSNLNVEARQALGVGGKPW